MRENNVPEFHQVEPRLSLAHFPPVKATINTAEDAVRFVCKNILNQSYYERVIGIYCDNQLHPVCYCILSEGGENYAMLTVKSILTPALLYGVGRMILVHNHPGGIGTPSREDCDFSYNAYRRCKEFGVCLLDSIIMPCGQDPEDIRFTSLAKEKSPGNPWYQERISLTGGRQAFAQADREYKTYCTD